MRLNVQLENKKIRDHSKHFNLQTVTEKTEVDIRLVLFFSFMLKKISLGRRLQIKNLPHFTIFNTKTCGMTGKLDLHI